MNIIDKKIISNYVHTHNINYRNIVEINNIKYDVSKLPQNINIIFNIISEPIENKIINLINSNNTNEMSHILKCLSFIFSKEYNIKFNSVFYNILNIGDGLVEKKDNLNYQYPMLLLNLGSTILMKFKSKKISYEILLPQRSLLIIYKNEFDIEIENNAIDIYNNKQYKRNKRYSIIFKHKIK